MLWHPLMRLPVFVMGVAGGLLHLRQAPLPGGTVVQDLLPGLAVHHDTTVVEETTDKEGREDRVAALILVLLLLRSVGR